MSHPKTSNRPALSRDRRTTNSGDGSVLRNLKVVLHRPMRVELKEGRPRLVLIERRRNAQSARPTTAQLCAEMRVRMLADGHAEAPELMRHLALVHDTLDKQGWKGLRALPAHVLGRAVTQVKRLAQDESSPALSLLLQRLQVIRAELSEAAPTREPSRAPDDATAPAVEVREVGFAEFEQAHAKSSQPTA